jgi:ribosomal peptide maturation radical SAM protein 1
LTRAELRTLLQGGVLSIQPGIESLSDEVLRLMHKGRRGLQNIQLLRWCAEVGMGVSWRILYGISGEPTTEYERMADMTPLLTHLRPPISCGPIALKRFSPYWTSPGHFGLKYVKPWPSYRHIYPLPDDEIEGMAYFFDYDYEDGRDPFRYSRRLRRRVGEWILLWQAPAEDRPRLEWDLDDGGAVIIDTRPGAVRQEHRLRDLEAKVCRFCDRVRSRNAILGTFSQTGKATMDRTLRSLVMGGLLLEDKDRFLSLVVRRD